PVARVMAAGKSSADLRRPFAEDLWNEQLSRPRGGCLGRASGGRRASAHQFYSAGVSPDGNDERCTTVRGDRRSEIARWIYFRTGDAGGVEGCADRARIYFPPRKA